MSKRISHAFAVTERKANRTLREKYIDFRTLDGATEKGCRFAPNAEASPMGFYFP